MEYTAIFTDGTEETYEAGSDWEAVTIAKREFVRYTGPDNTDAVRLVPENVYRHDEESGDRKQIY